MYGARVREEEQEIITEAFSFLLLLPPSYLHHNTAKKQWKNAEGRRARANSPRCGGFSGTIAQRLNVQFST